MTTTLARILLATALACSAAAAGCKKKESSEAKTETKVETTTTAAAEPPAMPPAATPPSTGDETAPAAAAEAALEARSGSKVTGVVRLAAKDGRVEVTVEATGLTPGEHGFHIHEKGDCSAPDAKSAGDHFNPDMAAHGAPEARLHHAGDFGNITADADGKASKTWSVDFISLADGPRTAIGKAFVVHGQPDDLKTQPSGNAGPRVACGVVVAK